MFQCLTTFDLLLLQMLMNALTILVRMEPPVPTLTEATSAHVIVDSLERTAIKVSR